MKNISWQTLTLLPWSPIQPGDPSSAITVSGKLLGKLQFERTNPKGNFNFSKKGVGKIHPLCLEEPR